MKQRLASRGDKLPWVLGLFAFCCLALFTPTVSAQGTFGLNFSFTFNASQSGGAGAGGHGGGHSRGLFGGRHCRNCRNCSDGIYPPMALLSHPTPVVNGVLPYGHPYPGFNEGYSILPPWASYDGLGFAPFYPAPSPMHSSQMGYGGYGHPGNGHPGNGHPGNGHPGAMMGAPSEEAPASKMELSKDPSNK
jgi:hypothetical protein